MDALRREREEEKGRPILVTKDSASDWLSANVVPAKGECPEAARRFGEEIEKLGYNRLTLKTDKSQLSAVWQAQ